LDNELATDDELMEIEEAAKKSVRAAQKTPLQKFLEPIKKQINNERQMLDTLATEREQLISLASDPE
jgi:hypothetical protein